MEELDVCWGNLKCCGDTERQGRQGEIYHQQTLLATGVAAGSHLAHENAGDQIRVDHVASLFTSCLQMLGEATVLFSPLDGFSWSDVGVLRCPPLPGVHTRGDRRSYHPSKLPRLASFHHSLSGHLLGVPLQLCTSKSLKNNEGIKEKGREGRETYPMLFQGPWPQHWMQAYIFNLDSSQRMKSLLSIIQLCSQKLLTIMQFSFSHNSCSLFTILLIFCRHSVTVLVYRGVLALWAPSLCCW